MFHLILLCASKWQCWCTLCLWYIYILLLLSGNHFAISMRNNLATTTCSQLHVEIILSSAIRASAGYPTDDFCDKLNNKVIFAERCKYPADSRRIRLLSQNVCRIVQIFISGPYFVIINLPNDNSHMTSSDNILFELVMALIESFIVMNDDSKMMTIHIYFICTIHSMCEYNRLYFDFKVSFS